MTEEQSTAVSRLLRDWAAGDQRALAQLLPLVYEELRRVAHYHLQRERPGHTLQSTALVHEAYLRLLANEPPQLRDRLHFMAIASRQIRQILVDHAREHRAAKRDAGIRATVADLDAVAVCGDANLLALDDALNDLYRTDERQAQIVDMKFFGGLSSPEVSEVLGVSRATVDRDWATARAWLARQMRRTES
jgi:RNA polymerase sigma factor (TIGR02999 family)